MLKTLLFFFVISVVLSSPCFANVEIKDQAIVNDLIVLQMEMDVISSAIMSCMDSGSSHKDCMCQNKSKFNQFTTTVNSVFKKHPSLSKYDLIHYRTSDGMINNQSLLGIKKQAEMALPCD